MRKKGIEEKEREKKKERKKKIPVSFSIRNKKTSFKLDCDTCFDPSSIGSRKMEKKKERKES